MKVKKRNGVIVDFDFEKIKIAIGKVGVFDEDVNLNIQVNLESYCDEILDIETIQDNVENVLMSHHYYEQAKKYILYREQRKNIREMAKQDKIELVDNYLGKLDWVVKENSNMGYSLQGLNNYISSEVTKNYWLNKIYPEEIRQAHKNGDIHIHDLNLLAPYCVGWSLEDLLLTGFTGVEGKIQSNPPMHFSSALGQIVNFMASLQGEAAGAMAFSNFDTYLSPFIFYDNLSFKDVKQALQEFVFNMNIPTRVGFQCVFSNVTIDMICPKHMEDTPVIIGGKYTNKTHKEFKEEQKLFNRAFAEIMLEGDSSGRIFSFPIPTYNISKDFNWDDEEYKPVWEMAGKYGIPYFANFINSDLDPEDIKSMCCRLSIRLDKLQKRGGGLFGSNPLTGSLNVTTINLPRLTYRASKEDNAKEFFFTELAKLMNICKSCHVIKRKTIEYFTERDLYPYSKFYLRSVKERTGKYWANHFSTIGLIGMNEACLNLLGKDLTDEESSKFAVEVMDFMRGKLEEFQEETGDLFNLEATPAEGTTYRLAQKDKKDFPEIIVANGESNHPFYTNSTHHPVNFTDDIFELLDSQDELQTKYTGGTVIHLFLGENITNMEIVKNIIKKVSENYKLPYFTLSPTFSVCKNHGYLSGKQETCEKCGEETEVYSRVVGYYRPVKQWNDGKVAEFNMRKTFKS